MKALQSPSRLLSEARSLEQASRLTEAAAAYQQLMDADPTNAKALTRLVTLYRKLKEPKKELAVIKNALAAYAQKDKASQEKWLTTHPRAANAGRAFLRSLGSTTASAFGTNPVVERLQKRKEVVEKKLGIKPKSKPKSKPKPEPKPEPKSESVPKPEPEPKKAAPQTARKSSAAAAKEKRAEARQFAAEQKKQAALERKREAQQKKATAAERKATAAAARKAQAAAKKAEAAAARKAQAAAKKAEAAAVRKAAAAAKKAAQLAAKQAAIPSLFIISLRYLVPLEKIDAALPKHTTFLDKHFTNGDFLVAGRQVPRTGGIIIARGKDRAAIEKIMKQDPFVKAKLASVDIVEFSAGKLNRKQWLDLK